MHWSEQGFTLPYPPRGVENCKDLQTELALAARNQARASEVIISTKERVERCKTEKNVVGLLMQSVNYTTGHQQDLSCSKAIVSISVVDTWNKFYAYVSFSLQAIFG